MRRILLPLAVAAVALALPMNASAVTVGVEANAELINSDRTPAQQALALDKIKAQGATLVRANVGWNELAGECGAVPAEQQRDHLNACYRWGVLDSLVQLAMERDITVLLSISRAPRWLH